MMTDVVFFFLSQTRARKGRASRKHTLHIVPGPSWPSEIIMRAGYVCKSHGEMVFARLSPPRATNLPVVAWPVPSSASPPRSPPLRRFSFLYRSLIRRRHTPVSLTCAWNTYSRKCTSDTHRKQTSEDDARPLIIYRAKIPIMQKRYACYLKNRFWRKLYDFLYLSEQSCLVFP